MTYLEMFWKTFMIAWVITRINPIKYIQDFLPSDKTWAAKLYLLLDKLTILICFKCLSFWLGLIITNFNIPLSATFSFIVMWYEKTIGKKETKINLD